MREALILSLFVGGPLAACGPAPWTPELPRVPGSSALLFASTRHEAGGSKTEVVTHELDLDQPLPVVLARDPAVPSGVQYDFFAAWLEGTLSAHELSEGEVHPVPAGTVTRPLATVVSGARFFSFDTARATEPAGFEERPGVPDALAELPIAVRSRCLGLLRGTILTAPTRAAPTFAFELEDGGAVVGFQPHEDRGTRMFHLDAAGEVREINLMAAPADLNQARRVPDGSIWLVTAGLELWRAASVQTKTATTSVLVGLERIRRPAQVPTYPAPCAGGESAREDTRGRQLRDFAVEVQGREVHAFYAMDRDGGLLVETDTRVSCVHRVRVRDSGVRQFVVLLDRDAALFSADSDTRLYRYEDGVVRETEVFGPEVLVTSVARLPTLGLVAASAGRLAFSEDGSSWRVQEAPDVSRPVALLEWRHPWAGESGIFMGGDFGQAGEWWPGEPRLCPKKTEALAPSGIRHLVALGDGALFVAQAPPGSTSPVAFVWVRP